MRQLAVTLTLVFLLGATLPAQKDLYVDDVKHAVSEIGREAKVLIAQKKIPWKKIGRDFVKQAQQVKSHGEHLKLLHRLLARLEDGHARIEPVGDGKEVRFPDEGKPWTGSGLLLARTKKGLFVRGAFATAKQIGIETGWQLVEVNGQKAETWLERFVADTRDLLSFSTDHHAEFYVLQRGLVGREGERWKLVFKTPGRKKRKKTLTFARRVRQIPDGPVAYPDKLEVSKEGNIRWTKTKQGFGYIHVRRSPGSIVAELDQALAAIGNPKGLILDYRNNTGGAFDHEAFMGRFIPEGEKLAFVKRYEGAGPKRYGGPIVVIVDGTTVSAGETGAGMFKEDGRAYMIGESPTAGMSSSKKRIELPSKLFRLRVSVRSNMGRFNEGKGIEGIGVIPHEIIPLDPKDLAKGRDTLIERAEKLLVKYPKKKVPYDPKDFGWKPRR